MKKNKGKMDYYFDRLESRQHPRTLKFAFEGPWNEVKDIIKIFGNKQAEFWDKKERLQYFPILHYKSNEVVADFKYCYEVIEELVSDQLDDDEWNQLVVFYDKNRITELYSCIAPNPNLSRLYNLPTYLIYDTKMTANEFRVLCAFKARAKKLSYLGGARVCGWSAQKLSKKLGLSRSTVTACIKQLEEIGYLTFIPKMSNKRNKIYKVNV